jgi:single-strand DNA-binding protein
MDRIQERNAMAGSLNKVMLIGNVGRDPEMRYLQSGEPVTTFSLATNRRWTGGDGQRREETEWHNVVAWGKLAEQCNEFLSKGRTVYVEGRLQTRSWDDQATGQKRFRTEIVANQMQMLDSARGRDGGAGPDDRELHDDRAGSGENAIDLDDTPF